MSARSTGSPRDSRARHETHAPSVEHYHAYGLLFRSSLPLPELTALDPTRLGAERQPDVTITTGAVPEHLAEPRAVGRRHEVDAEHVLLRVEGVGRYLVSRGEEIMIDPAPGAGAHEVRVFLLGSGLGGLLHQRGYLVLHASAIGTDDGAVLFAGASGAGKSTLLSELLRRGARMMVDDVCAISVRGRGRPVVVPSYPRTRLWGETAGRLAIDTTGLTRTRPHMDKYERQVPDRFWDRSAPLSRIYQLAGSNGDELSLTPVSPIEAFNAVLHHTYRRWLLEGLDRKREHFEMAARVARSAPVRRILRPVEAFRLEELADLVLADLEQPVTEVAPIVGDECASTTATFATELREDPP